jgi:hypothetical protein
MQDSRHGAWGSYGCLPFWVGDSPPPDADGDGVEQWRDNCKEVSNPGQCDTNRDGYGNACDADYDNNGVVGISDFNILRSHFGQRDHDPDFDPDVDSNCDGAIGIPDFNALRSQFARPPGPSGIVSAPGEEPCNLVAVEP